MGDPITATGDGQGKGSLDGVIFSCLSELAMNDRLYA